ncbi:hypothetical protein [Streptomyces sp. NPDC048272]|uniref:hypothetical protein n=1 Tax=Streptomyces sp. NPDC048272 TaxID=3154616 RepID=UPI0034235059
MADGRAPGEPNPTPTIKDTRVLIEGALAWIAIISAVVGFVKGAGGPVAFLHEVAVFGFAAYCALFVSALILGGISEGFSHHLHRELTDTAVVIVGGAIWLGLTALVRFQFFIDDMDYDPSNSSAAHAFACLFGGIVLALPVFVWLWFKGSNPIPHRNSS